jgi:hypothetical protein
MNDPARRALLGQTTFLKVGHHGSHNATPRRFVESLLPEGFFAMVPTLEGSPQSQPPERKWDIPRHPLLDSLQARSPGRVARSDRPAESGPDFSVHPLYTEVRVPI